MSCFYSLIRRLLMTQCKQKPHLVLRSSSQDVGVMKAKFPHQSPTRAPEKKRSKTSLICIEWIAVDVKYQFLCLARLTESMLELLIPMPSPTIYGETVTINMLRIGLSETWLRMDEIMAAPPSTINRLIPFNLHTSSTFSRSSPSFALRLSIRV